MSPEENSIEQTLPGLKSTATSRSGDKPEIIEMPLPAGFRFLLRGMDPPCEGRVFLLQRARQVIGRMNTDIAIDEPSISRKHAAIEIYDIDFAYVKDLASTNGTCLNGEMINAAKLRSGDTIAVGDCRLQFVVEPVTG